MNGTTAEKGNTVWTSQPKSSAPAEAVTFHLQGDTGASDRQRCKIINRLDSVMDSVPTWSAKAVVLGEAESELEKEMERVLLDRGPLSFEGDPDNYAPVLDGLMYSGKIGDTLPPALVANASCFTVSTLRPVLSPSFVQVFVTGPFVSTHSGRDSKQVSELHYLSTTTTSALVLVGSELHLPRSLVAVMDGQVVLHGATVGLDWNGCVLRIRCVGIGGKRRKKSGESGPKIKGKGMYFGDAIGRGVAGAVGKAAVQAAISAAKSVEKSTRPARTKAMASMRAGSLAAKMGRLVGRGDYKIAGNTTVVNSLIRGDGMSAYSSFGGDNSCCLIEHREFLGDIVTGSATSTPVTFPFAIGIVNINPGLSASFPWLAQIAQNYEEYKMLGFIAEFVSTTSPYNANSAMGEVIFTSQDNPTAPEYVTRSQLFNSEMSVSARLDQNLMYGIECKDPAVPWYQVRSGASSTPINLTDPAKFYYATSVASTFPQQSVIGELWFTYRVMFRGPILKQAGSGTVSATFNTIELGTTATPGFFSSQTGITTQSIVSSGRFALGSSRQKFFNIGTPTSPSSSNQGWISLVGCNIGDVVTITAAYNLVFNPTLSTVLPTSSIGINMPVISFSGSQYYYTDTITGARQTPPSVITQYGAGNFASGNTSATNQRGFTQVFSVQVTDVNPYVQLSWPTSNPGAVSSGVWPVCATSGTYMGVSSVTYTLSHLGSYKVAVNQSNTAAYPLPTYTSTPIWGDVDGSNLAVTATQTPSLIA